METNLLGHPGTMCCFIGDRHPAPSISASTHGQRNELSKNGGPRPKPCPLEPQGRCESSWHLLSSKSYKWCKNAHGVDLVVGPEVPINVCESRPFQFGLLGKSCTTWKKIVSLNLKHVQTVNSAELCFHLEYHRSIFGSFKRTEASADASSEAPQQVLPRAPAGEVEPCHTFLGAILSAV